MKMAAVSTIMMAPSMTAPNTKTTTLTMLPPSAVITATAHTDEMALKTKSPPTNDASSASNTTDIDTATAASPPVDPTLNTSSFTYSHEEVWQLLENARLKGWEEGYEEGSKRLMEGYRDGYEA